MAGEGSIGGQMLVIIIRLLYDFQYIYICMRSVCVV